MDVIKKSSSVLFLLLLIALLYSLASPSNQDYWIKQLSTEEKEIFDTINKERTAKKITPLLLNGELSDAIKEELIKFMEVESDSPTMEEQIKELFSHFQGKFYMLTDTTTEEILERLRQTGELEGQIFNRANLSVVIAAPRIKTKGTYTCIYFSEYLIDCIFHWEEAIFLGSDTGQLVSEKIEGKSNAKYLKILCYEGTKLPFLQQPEKVFEEELKLPEDSSFAVSLPIDKFKKEPWRIAVFVRNNPKEPYELVKFFKRGE